MRHSFFIDKLINFCRIAGHRDIYINRFFIYTQKRISDTSSHQKEGMFVFDLFLQETKVRIQASEVFKKKHAECTKDEEVIERIAESIDKVVSFSRKEKISPEGSGKMFFTKNYCFLLW